MGWGRNVLGVTPLIASVNGGNAASQLLMGTLNNGASYRFLAPDVRDIKSIWINFASSVAPGTIRIRIETDDGGGKPSGTLYDANATVDITPAAGWQNCVFATPPTTNLVAGSLYHIVMLATVAAGGSQTLRAYWTGVSGGYPLNALYATDGTTRTNFAENGQSVPVCTIVFSDNSEETCGFAAFAGSTTFNVYGTRAFGAKLVVPTGVTLLIVGGTIELGALRNGTPDDLRLRIFTAAGALVTGATIILPKGGLLNANNKRIIGRFPAAVSLSAGTYRAVWDQVANTSSSGNNWSFYSATHRASGLVPSYFTLTTTLDITAGTPTWVDTNTDVPLVGLQLDDASGSAAASARVLGG